MHTAVYPPFPVAALPDDLQAAVSEVHDYIQAPIPLIIAAALAPLSVACQGLYNVRRLAGLESPVSLYFLVIAASGERKSTADSLFRKPLIEFESRHVEAAEQAARAYAPLFRAWKAKGRGLEKAIEKAASKFESTEALTRALNELHMAEPKKPLPAPAFMHGDITTQAFKLKLSQNLPSAALISSEAGLIMGGRAMSEVAFFNEVWDGTEKITVERKAGDFTILSPRVTVSLMAQPGTTRRFFEKKGSQVRDIGLLARMLIAFPDSTQGTRFNPEGQPLYALDKYHLRISALLETFYENFKAGKPKATLRFTSQADQVCYRFYNEVEVELGNGRLLEDVRDHASKITENLARVAALFHVASGFSEEHPIDVDTAERAAAVCKWYVLEFFRLFGAPDEMSLQHHLATQLADDLTKLYQKGGGSATMFLKSDLYHLCHPKLREKNALNLAIAKLVTSGVISSGKGSDKKTYIWLTPNFFSPPPAPTQPQQVGYVQLPNRTIEHSLVQAGVGNFNSANTTQAHLATGTGRWDEPPPHLKTR